VVGPSPYGPPAFRLLKRDSGARLLEEFERARHWVWLTAVLVDAVLERGRRRC
jgi:hypothetical protein